MYVERRTYKEYKRKQSTVKVKRDKENAESFLMEMKKNGGGKKR